ncbi:MAG: hypothetical protein QN163_00960 [Armatimonadota bacterium]|nr:hypothetical protein [Armatimonadota bacterium]MDR5697632.1 hypothetical protein [Armatimonadota bacterium]
MGTEETVNPVEMFETTSTADVIVWCVGLLTHKARLHLGLIPGREQKDLEQARLAIDGAARLAELLEGKVHGDVLSELLMHIADLRFNYLDATRQ